MPLLIVSYHRSLLGRENTLSYRVTFIMNPNLPWGQREMHTLCILAICRLRRASVVMEELTADFCFALGEDVWHQLLVASAACFLRYGGCIPLCPQSPLSAENNWQQKGRGGNQEAINHLIFMEVLSWTSHLLAFTGFELHSGICFCVLGLLTPLSCLFSSHQ